MLKNYDFYSVFLICPGGKTDCSELLNSLKGIILTAVIYSIFLRSS